MERGQAVSIDTLPEVGVRCCLGARRRPIASRGRRALGGTWAGSACSLVDGTERCQWHLQGRDSPNRLAGAALTPGLCSQCAIMGDEEEKKKGPPAGEHKIEILKSDMNEEMIAELIKITGAPRRALASLA